MQAKIKKGGGGYSFGPKIEGRTFPAIYKRMSGGIVIKVDLPSILTGNAAHPLAWSFLANEVEVIEDAN